MKTSSIPILFEAARLAIYNTSGNKELQKKLAMYGITPQRVQEGEALLKTAQALQRTKEQHCDESRRLSRQLDQDMAAAREAFKEHVAIAKLAFRKEPHVLQELRISRVSDRKWGWVRQALSFYMQAPPYREKLQRYGAQEAQWQQNQAAVEALLALQAQRLKKKGDAENSTHVKDQAIRDLRAWYVAFCKLARIAFSETPQVLESFGIVVYTAAKKQKGNGTKTAQVNA